MIKKTRVYKLDLVTVAEPIDQRISSACDQQLAEGFRLVTSFIWQTDLVLIFQAVS